MKINYKLISETEILELSEKQFDAAQTPTDVRKEYYKQWVEFKNSLTKKQ